METRFFSKESHARNSFHFHDSNEILLIMSEGKEFYVRDKVYVPSRGSMFILNNTDMHRSVPREGSLYQFYSIRFYPEEIAGLSTPEFNLHACFMEHEDFVHRKQLNGDQLDHLLKLINKAEYYLSPDCSAYGKAVFIRTLLAEILVYINFLYQTPERAPVTLKGDISKMQPVIDYIDKNVLDDLSLDRLARECYMNKYYLSHRFKEIMGMPLSEYITSRRLAEAKILLRSGLSVTMSGEQSGFNSCSHFIRTFTKHEGISPKQYAKQYLRIDTYLSSHAPHRSDLGIV